jgi:hypothetical protein
METDPIYGKAYSAVYSLAGTDIDVHSVGFGQEIASLLNKLLSIKKALKK